MQMTDLSIFSPESILDALPRGALVVDLDWRIRYVNQSLARAVKCSAGDLVGEHLVLIGSKLGVVDSLHEMLDFLLHLTKNPPDDVQVRNLRVQVPDKKFVRVTVNPYCPNGGQKVGYLFTFVD